MMKLKSLLFRRTRDTRFRRPVPRSIEEVLRVAETRASALGHEYLGLSHLVLALLGGAAPTVEAELRRKGLDVERIAERIELALGRESGGLDAESRSRSGTFPITSRTRSVVELVAGFDRSPGRAPRLLLLIILAIESPPADILREEGLTFGAFDE
jgi:ATP-dependent Clp protease ATP-binding subunit ClpA